MARLSITRLSMSADHAPSIAAASRRSVQSRKNSSCFSNAINRQIPVFDTGALEGFAVGQITECTVKDPRNQADSATICIVRCTTEVFTPCHVGRVLLITFAAQCKKSR